MDTLATTGAHLDRAALDHLLDLLATGEVLHPAIVELATADARRQAVSEVLLAVMADPAAPGPARERATALVLGALLAASARRPGPTAAASTTAVEPLGACC